MLVVPGVMMTDDPESARTKLLFGLQYGWIDGVRDSTNLYFQRPNLETVRYHLYTKQVVL
ncbi:MAG: hypothetical protein B6D70_08270 [gamma proteobacterium symbiont of Stewartia floridana]|nr:MAG: hypothetical protein B6D70_08270 [gamma proteobacterium symbiont of Stewartia floridana]